MWVSVETRCRSQMSQAKAALVGGGRFVPGAPYRSVRHAAHELVYLSPGVLPDSPAYRGGGNCDHCRGAYRSAAGGMLHCAACNYDECSACFVPAAASAAASAAPLAAVLAVAEHVHALARSARRAASCDVCRAPGLTETMACVACNYDECHSCAALRTLAREVGRAAGAGGGGGGGAGLVLAVEAELRRRTDEELDAAHRRERAPSVG